MNALVWITAIYGLSGLLPLVGFLRLLRKTLRWKEETKKLADDRGTDGLTWGDLGSDRMKITAAPNEAWNQLRWDVGLVGGGVVLAAIASIWSVWI